MYIYSGKCRKGTVGTPAGFTDNFGADLFVGDIVVTFAVDEDDNVSSFGSLTAIVSDEWSTYSSGNRDENTEHKIDNIFPTAFVMGLKAVDHLKMRSGGWQVKKVKDHSEAIDGESWSAFGFNFKKS